MVVAYFRLYCENCWREQQIRSTVTGRIAISIRSLWRCCYCSL